MTVELANPEFFDGRGSIIVLELADEESAMRMAELIARDTGRAVRVRNAENELVGFVQAAQRQ